MADAALASFVIIQAALKRSKRLQQYCQRWVTARVWGGGVGWGGGGSCAALFLFEEISGAA
jgi:hypothetical protein